MENIQRSIFSKNCIMKKIVAVGASLVLVIVSANAQTEKKEPPPTPPPKEEVKYNVVKEPKVVDEKISTSMLSEPPVITVKGKRADDFYKRNPTVSNVSRQGSVITIKKKDGTAEKYDMNKKEEDKSFTEKYGISPIPPPPPPPKKVS